MSIEKLLEVKPIDHDAAYERDYIPLPGGWEIQTKGKGSTFRICDPKGDRLAIPDSPYLHEDLTQMARDVNAAWAATVAGLKSEIDRLQTEMTQAKELARGEMARVEFIAKSVIASVAQLEEIESKMASTIRDAKRWQCVRGGALMSDGRPIVSVGVYEKGKYIKTEHLLGQEADIMVDAILRHEGKI